jgi:plastocyanin
MLARRLLIALAVLMLLTALAASLAPRESAVRDDTAATPAAPATATVEPVQETLDASAEGQRVEARVGQTVTIVVRSDTLDTVSLAEMGAETTEPDSPARFELLADTPGSYPIELLESGRRIGVLEISD